MRHSFLKLFSAVLLVSLLIISGSIYTYAAGSLTISAPQTSYGPQEKVEITLQELNDSQQPITGAATLKVKISRGGLVNQSILQKGLSLENGIGKFTFITPSKPGNADILVIDPENNLSAKLSLQINENQLPGDWKAEFASITKIKGRVAIRYSGKETWDSALTDSKLHEADTIMTWDKSWTTLQLFDGSELILQPCTTLYIKSLKSSGANTPIKQSVFKLFTGKVLAKAKQYLEKGSKFEIESESATAGVKGTFFEFGSAVDGAVQLIVYEGTVFMEQLRDEFLFAIPAGQQIFFPSGNSNPAMDFHSITPEQRDKTLLDAEAAVEEEQGGDGGDDNNGASGDDSGTEGGGTDESNPPKPTTKSKVSNVLFGSQMIDGSMYFNLRFQPEFKNIFGTGIGLGLDLTLYQDADKNVHIGGPNGNTVNNFINWAEFNGKNLYLRYGAMSNISYDPGLLFSGYTKIKDVSDEQSLLNNNSTVVAKGFQFGLKNIPVPNLGFKVLVPFDIKSFSPWVTEQTSSLYAGRIYYDYKLLGIPFEIGATYVMDTDPRLKERSFDVPTSGAAVDCIMPLSTLATPYVEVANLIGFGSGAEIGIRGNILSLIQYQGGLRFVTDGFVPNYFGNSYELLKNNFISGAVINTLPDLSIESSFASSTGYYANVGLGLFSWIKVNVRYENFDNMTEYAPILTGRLDLKSPALFSLPSISGGLLYRKINFNDFKTFVDLDEDTSYSWYVKYPISEGVSATYVKTWNPVTEKFNDTMSMSVDF